MRTFRDPVAGHAAALGFAEAALEGFVVVDGFGEREGSVEDEGVDLVFEFRRKRARVGEFGGGAAGVVQGGHRVGGGAVGPDAEHAVTGNGGAAVVGVGVVVGGDEGEVAVPKFALGVGVDGVEGEDEARGRLEVGREQQGVFQDVFRAVLEIDRRITCGRVSPSVGLALRL